jgi:hypothetical protein
MSMRAALDQISAPAAVRRSDGLDRALVAA